MSIQHTRRGYHYQDKYALLVLLRALKTGDLDKFYVDYSPPGSSSSLDIRLVFKKSKEEIQEVKTGEQIKENKKDLFFVSLVTLLEHLGSRSEEIGKAILVADPEFKHKVLIFWGEINAIKERGINSNAHCGDKTVRSIARAMHEKVKKCAKKNTLVKEITLEKMGELLKNIELNQGPAYAPESVGYPFMESDIEKLIIGELDYFGKIAGCEATGGAEFDNRDIISVLLEVIRIGAEKNSDVSVFCQNKLVDCLSKRMVIGERGRHDSTARAEDQLKTFRKSIEEKIVAVSKIKGSDEKIDILSATTPEANTPAV